MQAKPLLVGVSAHCDQDHMACLTSPRICTERRGCRVQLPVWHRSVRAEVVSAHPDGARFVGAIWGRHFARSTLVPACSGVGKTSYCAERK